MFFSAGSDDQHSGTYTDKCELAVYGTLNADGVVFRSSNTVDPSNSDWEGITVRPGGSASITNSTIRDAVWGVYNEGTLVLDGTQIANSATGVSTYSFGQSPSTDISNTEISGGGVTSAGMYFYSEIVGMTATVRNNLIYDTAAEGITFSTGSDVTLENNTIADNASHGIEAYQAEVIVKNNIISGNGGAGVKNWGYSTLTFSYNDVWGNQAGNYVDCSPGTGDISVDPFFADDQYHLYSNSPCRDAGDPDQAYNDPDGTRNDMGAYGGPGGTTYNYPDPPIPTAPSNLSASAASSTQINLSGQDNSNNENGFKIERSTDGTNFSQIDTVGANIINYSDTGLLHGEKYYYRVRAYNYYGNSDYSNTASATTSLPSPSNLSASAVSSTQIDLSWQDNSNNEDGFKIERSTDGSTFSQIATVGPNSTSYSNTGLLNGEKYYYRVRAYTEHVNSGYSNTASAITSLPSPSNLSASAASSTKINISWQDNSNNEDGFKIERSTDGSTFSQIATVGPNSTSYSNTGLLNGEKYYYRVRAYTEHVNSGYSNTASATTSLPSPSNLSASAVSSTKIDLSWTDNSNNEDGFKIERSTDGSTFSQIAAVGAGVTSYSNTGLSPNTTYYYRVRAYTEDIQSGYSNTASATTYGPPIPPSNLTASPISSTRIDLSWTDNSNNEDGFKIERKTDETSFSQIARVGPNSTSYSNTGLLNGEKYYYRVRAYNNYGDSDYSNTASATTTLPAPSGLSAYSVSSNTIRISWTDNSNNEDGFKIERSTDGSSFSQIATTTSTYYYDGSLDPNTKYYFRVRAYTEHTNSAYSNTASAITRPGAPTLDSATPGPYRVTLSWTAPSGSASGYKIRYWRYDPYTYWTIDVGDVTTYTVDGLTAGVTYYFRVAGYNADGQLGSWSNTKSATPTGGGCW